MARRAAKLRWHEDVELGSEEGQHFLFHRQSKTCIRLDNEIARDIVGLIDGERSQKDICRSLQDTYEGVKYEALLRGVEDVVSVLVEERFVHAVG